MRVPVRTIPAMTKQVAPASEFHSVTPRMIVSDVTAQVEFLRAVFDATGDIHADRPAEIRIGNSIVLISRAGDREVFPAFLYVYVDDADRVYQRALAAGATSMEPPRDTPYGDRRAMVRDTSGNIFQIAHRSSTATPQVINFDVTPIGRVE
jgi:PhnB protein